MQFFGTLKTRTPKTPIFSPDFKILSQTPQGNLPSTPPRCPPPALLLMTTTTMRTAANCAHGMRILKHIITSSLPPLPIPHGFAGTAGTRRCCRCVLPPPKIFLAIVLAPETWSCAPANSPAPFSPVCQDLVATTVQEARLTSTSRMRGREMIGGGGVLPR